MSHAVTTRRIFLARHGNRQDLVDPGWLTRADEPYDPPLSSDGVEQARRLGQRLAREGIDSIVASPFLRAVQTAHHANEALARPILLEPGFGEWLSSHSFERPPRLAPPERLQRDFGALGAGYAPSGGLAWPETRDALRERTHRALSHIVRELDGTVLVVSHAAPIAAAVLIDEQVTRVECPMCALFCLEYSAGRWQLVLDGEIAHVGERLACFTYP